MSAAMLVARITLAFVFGLAGAVKLFDLKRSSGTLADFGLPSWLAAPLGFCLPFIELSVACLLLPVKTIWWGGLASVVLLGGFVIGIVANLARGKRPDCNCFGQLYSEPIGPSTLVRNVVLLLLAVTILARASHDPGLSLSVLLEMSGRDALLSVFGVGLLLAVIVAGWLIMQLFRQNGRLLLRIEALEAAGLNPMNPQAQVQPGLRIGATAPPFELPLARGGGASLGSLRELGKPILLVFSDFNCGPCKALSPDIARWERELSGKLTIAVISRGATSAQIARQHDMQLVFVQKDREVAAQYQASGTPGAVLITAGGLVASSLVLGAPAIGELVSSVATGGQMLAQPLPVGLPIGSRAPSVTLPDLTGKPVSIEAFNGRRTMLLFWNPDCGFCARMLGGLKDWERTRTQSGLRLLLISTGTPERNRAMELSSPVLLDRGQGVAQLFGSNGTPSALLIDEHGKVATQLAQGADAVFSMLSGHPSYPLPTFPHNWAAIDGR